MKVIVFTMEGCPWCDELKGQLDESNVEYEARDINEYSTMYNNFAKITECELLPSVLIGKEALVPEKSFQTIEECVDTIESLLVG